MKYKKHNLLITVFLLGIIIFSSAPVWAEDIIIIEPDPIVIIEPDNSTSITVDLWGAFPEYQGENNFYAYRFDGADYTELLPNTSGTDLSFTINGGPSNALGIPIVERDQDSAHPINDTGHWLFLHPGEEDAVLGWMAPEDIYADIDLTFLHPTDEGGNGINVYLKKNDQLIDSGTIFNGPLGFNTGDIFLSAGDFLYFGINANGPSEYDWGHLKGTITYDAVVNPVPVPTTMMLFGSVVFGIVGFRRKVKKA